MPNKKRERVGGVKSCFRKMERGLNDAYYVNDKSGEASLGPDLKDLALSW